MSRILVVGEVGADGALARISAEIATLARTLAEAGGHQVRGLVVAADPDAAATELARYLPEVEAVAAPELARRMAPQRVAVEADLLAADTDFILTGASPDGRDVAGILSARLGWGVLTNATGVTWGADGPIVEMSVFGGRLVTWSALTAGQGIVTVRPNATTAEPAAVAGRVTRAASRAAPTRRRWSSSTGSARRLAPRPPATITRASSIGAAAVASATRSRTTTGGRVAAGVTARRPSHPAGAAAGSAVADVRADGDDPVPGRRTRTR